MSKGKKSLAHGHPNKVVCVLPRTDVKTRSSLPFIITIINSCKWPVVIVQLVLGICRVTLKFMIFERSALSFLSRHDSAAHNDIHASARKRLCLTTNCIFIPNKSQHQPYIFKRIFNLWVLCCMLKIILPIPVRHTKLQFYMLNFNFQKSVLSISKSKKINLGIAPFFFLRLLDN